MVMVKNMFNKKKSCFFTKKRQWSLLRIIVKNALTILPPEPKDFGFPEAARGVMKVKVTPAER